MTKSQKFLLAISSNFKQLLPKISRRLFRGLIQVKKITFFNWKMFDIKIKDNIAFCDYNFDTEERR